MASNVCTICRLVMPPDSQTAAHGTTRECIQALQATLIRQNEAARTIAFEISTQFLAVLEHLAMEPDVGIVYKAFDRDPQTGAPTLGVVETSKVAGVFAAILKKYRSLGDWSPLEELRAKVRDLEAELAARPPAVRPPDPAGS